MKNIIIKTHDTSNTINEISITTHDGQPDVIQAVKNVNYEFFDESIGRAPNHIITRRFDNDLHVSFEREGKETDLIIEGFYHATKKQDEANQIDSEADNSQALIGLSEDGVYYHYIPDTGQVYDYVTQLEIGSAEGQALGGEGMVTPWWVTTPVGFPWWLALGLIPLLFIKDDDDDDDDDSSNDPVANDDSVFSAEGESVIIDIISNDTDKDNDLDPTTVKLLDPDGAKVTTLEVAGEGTWTVDPDTGSVTFTPEPDLELDPTPIEYIVLDKEGNQSNSATITIDYQAPPEIDIPEDPPVISEPGNEGSIEGDGDKVVFEGDGPVESTFMVTAEAGIASITVAGEEVTTATEADPVTIITDAGTLVITGFNTETGIVSYSYDPNVLNHTGSDPIIDSHSVVVVDNNGSQNSDSLDVVITDSSPIANDDTNSVSEDGEAITGSLIANDIFGEDGQGVPAVTAVTDLATDYGTISIAADGSYTYSLDSTNPIVNALDSDSPPLTDTVTYSITDGDGDSTTADLVITINGETDGPPKIIIPTDPPVPPTPSNEGAAVDVGDKIVFEGDGPVEGSFTVTAEAGIASITVAGEEITTATEADPVTITTDEGTLVITGFNTETGIVSYNYDPNVFNHTGSDPIIDSHSVVVVDDNGVEVTESLDIVITDSLPVAQDDVIAIVENTELVNGTVISNDGFGEDGQGDPAVTAVTDLATDYGTISIAADGSYSYILDNTNSEVNALNSDSPPLTDTVTYSITDGDGDSTTADLVITINGETDGPPKIIIPTDPPVPPTSSNEGAAVDVGDKIVFEGDGPVEGTFTVTAQAGVASITVAGEDVTIATEADPVIITTDEGTLVITGVNAVTGIVSYSYDPNVLNHTGSDPIIDSHSVVVVDHNGVEVTESLDIVITDSLPVAQDDVIAIVENTASVTGTLLSNDVFGEDGQGDPAVTAVTDLTTDYGTISIAADGSYTYSLDNTNSEVNALSSDSPPLTDTVTYSITDGDGDSTTADLVITINGETDGPPKIIIPTDPPVPPTPSDEGAAVDVGDKIVFEGEDAVAGSFTVTAQAGIASITVAGEEITTATEADPVTIITDAGTLVITGFNTETGIVSYSYDPNVLNHTGSDPIIDSHSVVVVDDNGEEVTESLDIVITDSLPVAQDDTVAIVENTASVTGTLLSNDGFGEDGQGDPAVTAVTDLATDYGTISIAADGSYSYILDNTNSEVNALDSDSPPLTDTVTYNITDGDGDSTTANLVITINGETDAPPQIIIPTDPAVPPTPSNEGAAVDVGDKIVFEGEDAVAGSFTVTAQAGIASITVAGEEVTTATEADPVTIITDAGTLVITGFNTETGIVSYSYDPNVLNHTGSDPIIDSHSVVVVDDNGEEVTESLDIVITDSLPVAQDDTVAIVENTELVNGTVISNDGFGEDGQGDPAVTAVTDLATDYGTISIAADGSYSYILDNTNSEVNALSSDSPPLTDTVTYSITDGDGDSTTANLLVSISGTNDEPEILNISPVLVSEEALKFSIQSDKSNEGLLEEGTDDSDDTFVDTGVITFTDADNTDLNDFSVLLYAPTTALTVEGQTVTWTQSGNTLTGKINYEGNDIDVMTLETKPVTQSGSTYSIEFETTLLHAIDQPVNNDEDTLSVNFTATISDGINTSSAIDLEVEVEDDRPTCPEGVIGIPLAAISSNVSIILDTSGSMGNDSGIAGKSRADVAAESIIKLLDGYNNIGETRVQLVRFATEAQVEPQWLTIDQAKAIINNLASPADGTNYDDALFKTIESYDNPGALANATNYSYFLTDGKPSFSNADINTLGGNDIYTQSANADEGINPVEQATWTEFLTDKAIKSYALGLSDDLAAADIANLEPITFNGIDNSNDESELTQAVTDLTQLDDILLSTLPTADKTSDLVRGDFLSIEAAGFGADGGHINSITIDDITYTYDRENVTVIADQDNITYLFDAIDRELIVFTDLGGKLNIDLETGAFGYLSVASLKGYQENLTYAAIDNDGDIINSSQVLDIYRLIARDDLIITNDTSATFELDTVSLMANDSVGVSSEFDGVFNVSDGSITGLDPLILSLNNPDAGMTFNYSVIEKNVEDSASVTVQLQVSEVIEGTESSDVLIGRAGQADTINASVGNDVLQGKSGNDIMTGDIGDDVFVWAANDKGVLDIPDIDTITDFGTGNDLLHLSDLLQNENLNDITAMKEYVSWDSVDSTLYVSSQGEFIGGVYDSAKTDLIIQLDNFSTDIDTLITDYIV